LSLTRPLTASTPEDPLQTLKASALPHQEAFNSTLQMWGSETCSLQPTMTLKVVLWRLSGAAWCPLFISGIWTQPRETRWASSLEGLTIWVSC
jgi:hypothetical protein